MPAINLGGTGDPTNYYTNTYHAFYSRDFATRFASIWSSGLEVFGFIRPGIYTVATLPAGSNGTVVYASNARKVTEGAGAGTGVIAFYSNGNWRRLSDDSPVAA
ncbi:hypothetical protein FF100_15565 [Methylobacterium terricola]|uniref:Uncharacterized protein n=1 Tax=Methylobacterium terricola TaxID=2583531 RepID=A0A5C4LGF5_9HYPH|nr:hypothetical protein FF100_15565 [Methylobacterium terricola]